MRTLVYCRKNKGFVANILANFFSSNGGMHLGLLARLVFLIFVLANRGFFSIGAFEGAKTCFSEVR